MIADFNNENAIEYIQEIEAIGIKNKIIVTGPITKAPSGKYDILVLVLENAPTEE
jgi:hypothetical protein